MIIFSVFSAYHQVALCQLFFSCGKCVKLNFPMSVEREITIIIHCLLLTYTQAIHCLLIFNCLQLNEAVLFEIICCMFWNWFWWRHAYYIMLSMIMLLHYLCSTSTFLGVIWMFFRLQLEFVVIYGTYRIEPCF